MWPAQKSTPLCCINNHSWWTQSDCPVYVKEDLYMYIIYITILFPHLTFCYVPSKTEAIMLLLCHKNQRQQMSLGYGRRLGYRRRKILRNTVYKLQDIYIADMHCQCVHVNRSRDVQPFLERVCIPTTHWIPTTTPWLKVAKLLLFGSAFLPGKDNSKRETKSRNSIPIYCLRSFTMSKLTQYVHAPHTHTHTHTHTPPKYKQ